MNIHEMLNEVLVRLFRNINTIEENAIKQSKHQNMTTNDMHVIEAIGIGSPKNMPSVARSLMVTTGTLTISVNSLVKKGFVERTRSDEDRRVVLVSLTEKGKEAFRSHQQFHDDMVEAVTSQLSMEEQEILQKALSRLNKFFREEQEKQSPRKKDQ